MVSKTPAGFIGEGLGFGNKLSLDSSDFYPRCFKAYRRFVFASTVWQRGVFALAGWLLFFVSGKSFFRSKAGSLLHHW